MALNGMVRVEGTDFEMGSGRFYPEEAPVRRVAVDSFWIDETPVTNRQFAAFVDATGYVTEAERCPPPSAYPGAPAEVLQPGSVVFSPLDASLERPLSWWAFRPGASWRHPYADQHCAADAPDHPVVQVSFADANAFAVWAGKSLPTEAEWELAARGGLKGAEFAWGNVPISDGHMLCNFWQGEFPTQNLLLDGWARTSPVGFFPANGLGLYDMIGNVWEWTDDWYSTAFTVEAPARACCVPRNPRGGCMEESLDRNLSNIPVPRKVLKGGSHLCAANYCLRYRPAARVPQMVDSATTHIGFRCVVRDIASP